MGPEAIAQFINADEAIKRLAAAQGIDILNLVKTMEERNAEQEQAMQAQQMQSLTDQAGQLANAPMMDPSKNPEALEAVNKHYNNHTVIMAETIRYDTSDDPVVAQDQAEKEAESLKIGEDLMAKQDKMLAGKYKSAEELESAYLELQKKLGDAPAEQLKIQQNQKQNINCILKMALLTMIQLTNCMVNS